MSREAPIRAEGRVVRILSDRLYEAELPNGKRVNAFLTHSAPPSWGGRPPGSTLVLHLTPYDFSHAEVVGMEEVKAEKLKG